MADRQGSVCHACLDAPLVNEQMHKMCLHTHCPCIHILYMWTEAQSKISGVGREAVSLLWRTVQHN